MDYKINDKVDQDKPEEFDSDKAFDEGFDSDQAFESAPSQSTSDISQSKPIEMYEKPSMTESALHGAAQGLSFGFADEAEAALKALKEDRPYDEIIKEVRQRYKEAEEMNPMASLAGNIVGGIVPGGALSSGLSAIGKLKSVSSALKGVSGLGSTAAKATGLAKVAKSSPKLTRIAQIAGKSAAASIIPGAIAGAGTSEEEGKAQGALEGAVTGAVTGGVIGGVAQAGKQAGKVLNKIPFVADAMDSLGLGTKGKEVITKEGGQKLWDTLENKAQKFAKQSDDMLSGTAQLKKITLELADKNKKTHKIPRKGLIDSIEGLAQKVNIGDDITRQEQARLQYLADKLKLNPSDKLSPSEAYEAYNFLQKFSPKEAASGSKQVQDLAMDILTNLADYRKGIPKTYFHTAMKKLEQSGIDKQTLKNLYKLHDIKTGNLIENLDDTMSSLMTLKNEFGVELAAHSQAGDKKFTTERLIDLLAAQGKDISSSSAAKAGRKLEVLSELLERAYGDEGTRLKDLKQAGRAVEIFRKAQGMDQSGNLGGFVGLGRIATVGGANVAGIAYNKTKDMIHFPSPALKGIANRIRKNPTSSNISKMLANSLDEMANISEEGKRKAIMNKLLQTPAYRMELNKLLGIREEE